VRLFRQTPLRDAASIRAFNFEAAQKAGPIAANIAKLHAGSYARFRPKADIGLSSFQREPTLRRVSFSNLGGFAGVAEKGGLSSAPPPCQSSC
jgi:hypothetical protein